jgi:hypothetical protein
MRVALSVAITAAALLLGACDPSAGAFHDLFNPPAGPNVSIVPPAVLHPGVPAEFQFVWTGGEAPFSIEVDFMPARYEQGILIVQGDATPISWTQENVSSGVSHEFTLPFLAGEFDLYDVTAMVKDTHYDPGSLGGGFFPGYQAWDLESMVLAFDP